MARSPKILTLCGALLLAGTALAAYCWYTWDRSVYAQGYSEDTFRQVAPGMTEGQVTALLGPPLSVDSTLRRETWYFQERSIESGTFRKAYRLLDPAQFVEFDRDGLVSRASGDSLRRVKVAMTKAEVLTAVGEPDRRTPRVAKLVHYSSPSDHGLYRARMIGFGDDGTVADIIAYESYD